jgi:hypothetical protein
MPERSAASRGVRSQRTDGLQRFSSGKHAHGADVAPRSDIPSKCEPVAVCPCSGIATGRGAKPVRQAVFPFIQWQRRAAHPTRPHGAALDAGCNFVRLSTQHARAGSTTFLIVGVHCTRLPRHARVRRLRIHSGRLLFRSGWIRCGSKWILGHARAWER